MRLQKTSSRVFSFGVFEVPTMSLQLYSKIELFIETMFLLSCGVFVRQNRSQMTK